ncbi:hypothetical protein F5888DRAFT_1121883 [Russula emetica]|nr:hypothetical protein F5888DRAFT_1121883 [Russula emetica]
MNPVSNRFNGGLPKGKAKDAKDVALSPPSTPSYQKKNLPPLPPLSEWPPPLELPRLSIGTPTSITPFEPFPKAELSSLPLLSIGDTEDYITTSTAYSRVPLPDIAVEESSDTAVTFGIASPRDNHDSDSLDPPLPPLNEWPPPQAPLEQPRRSIGTATLISSSEYLPELSSLPIPLIADRADYNPTTTTNSRIPPSDVAVDVSADSDITVAFDIASPRIDQDLAERSSRENGNGNINTSYVANDALPSPPPVKLDCNDGKSIDQPLPLTRPPCWSEGAEEDLVAHLGPSERSRQEIMWEIVASEERYVAELLKMRENVYQPPTPPICQFFAVHTRRT